MIDLVKINFKDFKCFEKHIIDSKIGNINSKYLFIEDEYIYPIRTEIQNLKINITSKGAYIENSIHKYYNSISIGKNSNYNDFNYCDLVESFNQLENTLKYKLDNTYITRFEFGLNIDLGFNPSKFLEENILFYKYKTPCYEPKNKKNEKIIKFIYSAYEIKIYDKSLQYGLSGGLKNIVRVEVKYKSRRLIQKLGIYSLKDLTKKECLNIIYKDFINKIKDITIIDNYKGHINMENKEKELFLKFTNANYWIDLKTNHSKNLKYNYRNKFLELIDNYELNTIKQDLIIKLESKFEELINSINNKYSHSLIA